MKDQADLEQKTFSSAVQYIKHQTRELYLGTAQVYILESILNDKSVDPKMASGLLYSRCFLFSYKKVLEREKGSGSFCGPRDQG